MDKGLPEYVASPEFMEATANLPRMVGKLKTAIEQNQYYEVHLILRTIHFRLIPSKDKHAALTDLLYKGSCFLLDKNEIVSGQDIATLYTDASATRLTSLLEEFPEKRNTELQNTSLSYHKSNSTIDYIIATNVANIAGQLPDSEVGLKKFLADTFKKLKFQILSKAILHETLAKQFWVKKDYPNSRYNYLYCANLENAKDISQLLVEYHTGSANRYETDLFLTQFIFQFLCIQQPLDVEPRPGTSTSNRQNTTSASGIVRRTRLAIKNIAEKIFTSYILLHPQLEQETVPYTSMPLLNFTHFIISMLGSTNEAEMFTTLMEVYRTNWSRDPNYETYLTKIGTLYFGIAPPQRSGGIFDNILQSLFDEGDQSEHPAQEAVDDLD